MAKMTEFSLFRGHMRGWNWISFDLSFRVPSFSTFSF